MDGGSHPHCPQDQCQKNICSLLQVPLCQLLLWSHFARTLQKSPWKMSNLSIDKNNVPIWNTLQIEVNWHKHVILDYSNFELSDEKRRGLTIRIVQASQKDLQFECIINHNIEYIRNTTDALVHYLSFLFSLCSWNPRALSLQSVVSITCL